MSLTRRDFIKYVSIGIASGLFQGSVIENIFTHPDYVLLKPDSKQYLKHKIIFNKRIDLRPAYIAVCRDESGVQKAIEFANVHDLPVAVKSGGHSYEGFSLNEGGLVVDLSYMNHNSIYDDIYLRAGPATTVSEINDYLLPKKRLIPLGSCGGIGLAGLTLGGGTSIVSRAYGLTCDYLTGVRLVDGNGQVVDSDYNHELLWACRGGGNGNFGVVTELRYKTLESPDYAYINSIQFNKLNVLRAIIIIKSWFAQMTILPVNAYSYINIKNGHIKIELLNYDEQSGKVISDIKNHLARYASSVEPEIKKKLSAYLHEDLNKVRRPRYFKDVSGGFMKDFNDISGIADELLMNLIRSKNVGLTIYTLGGSVSDKSRISESAIVFREFPFLSQIICNWNNKDETASRMKEVNKIQAILANSAIKYHYRNYPGLEIKNWEYAYYGKENYERLSKLKRVLDPDNRFSYPQSIKL